MLSVSLPNRASQNLSREVKLSDNWSFDLDGCVLLCRIAVANC
jgi:hypothetical protein